MPVICSTMTCYVATACAMSTVLAFGGQSLPRDLKEWRLDYGRNGGIAGVMLHVTLARDGAIVVEDKARDGRVTGRASDDLMVKLSAFLRVARDEKPSAVTRPPVPDQIGQCLSVTTGGREYRLEVTSQLVDLMDEAMNVAAKHALVGTRRQSAWKLCKPMAQLAMSVMDPPIEAQRPIVVSHVATPSASRFAASRASRSDSACHHRCRTAI